MPNRLIKESICTSEEIDALTSFEETVFYRLIVNCDDFGRMDARPPILKARLFPLKKQQLVDEIRIENALESLLKADLIIYYIVNNKPYVQMKTWEAHQQVRAKKSKYPSPDDGICYQMIPNDSNYCCYDADDDDCDEESKSNDIKCSRNPIQSESNPNPNPLLAQSDDEFANELDMIDEQSREEKKDVKPKKKKQEQIDETPVVFQLLLNDNTMYDVHQSLIDELKELYPNVNVEQEFRNMIGWIKGNPQKKKTRTGISRFIHSWLARQQNKGGNNNQPRYGSTGVQLATQRDDLLDNIF